jgi:type II secretory ATPase GspE/PulE/Tfp pilus assembly ATPase PilB-like protein
MSDLRIGELLIRNGLVTQLQVAEALQRPNPSRITLGQQLRAMGLVKKEDLDNILELHRKRLKLGEILLRESIIDEAKLNHALAISKIEKSHLGETLIKLRYIEVQHLARGIASQYDIPFVTLRNLHFDAGLASYINASFALRHRIVAIFRKENLVTIAMEFPLEKRLLQDIELAARVTVNPVISMGHEIADAQKIVYRTGVAPSRDARELQVENYQPQSREKAPGKGVDEPNSPETEQMVRQIVTVGVKSRASDIHMERTEEGIQIRFRVDGFLQSLNTGIDQAALNRKAQAIVSKIKVLCELDIAERRRPQDGSFRMRATDNETVRVVDFRVSTLQTEYGEDLVIRILDREGRPLTLSVLGLTGRHVDAIHDALETSSGFFLVTGPTGCGKSATLHAMLAQVNKPGLKSMAVEDPIECTLSGVRQAEVNEAVGNSFSRILKTFMRQDPDNIMVGEIRDPESAGLAVRAALTGHTLLSTLQTKDATSAVARLLDMGIEPSFIASTLRCVLSQRLVRVVCRHCKEPYLPSAKTLATFPPFQPPTATFYRGKGCPACNFTGFSGRRPISELWIPSEEELLQICQRPDNLSLRRLVFVEGKRPTMLQDGLDMVLRGETSLDELLRVIPVSQLAEIRIVTEDRGTGPGLDN